MCQARRGCAIPLNAIAMDPRDDAADDETCFLADIGSESFHCTRSRLRGYTFGSALCAECEDTARVAVASAPTRISASPAALCAELYLLRTPDDTEDFAHRVDAIRCISGYTPSRQLRYYQDSWVIDPVTSDHPGRIEGIGVLITGRVERITPANKDEARTGLHELAAWLATADVIPANLDNADCYALDLRRGLAVVSPAGTRWRTADDTAESLARRIDRALYKVGHEMVSRASLARADARQPSATETELV